MPRELNEPITITPRPYTVSGHGSISWQEIMSITVKRRSQASSRPGVIITGTAERPTVAATSLSLADDEARALAMTILALLDGSTSNTYETSAG